MKTKKQPKVWQLGGHLLFEDKDGIDWIRWSDAEKKLYGEKYLTELFGHAHIEEGTLLIHDDKVRSPCHYKMYYEVEKELSRYPKWNKTKYYVVCGDLGSSSGLLECKTHKLAPERVADEIMPKLRFKKSSVFNS